MTDSPAMRRFAVLTAAMTLALILSGGFVTTTRTGDSISGWPFLWGRLEPGFPIEWTHRALAMTVGLLVAALAFWARRPLGWIALGAVAVQALIGGRRVLVPQQAVAIVHAVFAQVVFCALMVLAFGQRRAGERPAAFGIGLAATAAAFLQLVAGAVTRHTGAGLAVHLAGAGVVLVLASLFVSRLLLTPLHAGAMLLVGILVTQILLGAASWFINAEGFVRSHHSSPLQIVTITAHVAVGALVLATTLILTLKCRETLEPALT